MSPQAETSVFNKRSFLMSVYVISLAIVLVYILFFGFHDIGPPRNIIMWSFLILLGIGYLVTWRSKSVTIVAHYYTTICFAGITLNCITRGGVAAPGMIWYMICPMVSFLTISFTAARVWLVVVLTTMIAFYMVDSWLVQTELTTSKFWNLLAYTMFLMALYFMLRAFRSKVVSRAIELLRVNALLEEKQTLLESSQAELQRQHRMIEEARALEAERSQKLRYYLDQHLEIARMEEIHTGSFLFSIQAIQNFLIKSLAAESTAIWYLRPDSSELKLIGSQGRYSQNKYELNTLRKENFPEAYEMFESGAIVISSAEYTASRELTMLMRHNPHDTSLIIGCPFFIEGRFGGFFICKTSARTWFEEDIIFIRAVSDTLSLAFKSHQRKLHQRLLEQKTKEVEETNQSLEQKVAERTMALNNLNGKLTDIAYTNAHVIRGPICRLVGLKNLLSLLNDETERQQLIMYMEASIDELDSITRSTSEQLNILVSK